jgi:hypothetical protein
MGIRRLISSLDRPLHEHDWYQDQRWELWYWSPVPRNQPSNEQYISTNSQAQSSKHCSSSGV